MTVDNISVTYNNARLALYDASCQVQPGKITGLVGPNGGGKSTLFKSIMGFLTPSQGKVYVDACACEALPEGAALPEGSRPRVGGRRKRCDPDEVYSSKERVPREGTREFNGLPIHKAQKKQLMAYVPQADEVDWNFPVSVADVVMMGRYGYMNMLRIPRAQDRRLVKESLARVGMTDFSDRQIGELSGGQKKRAFLARALAQEGKIMLLDEPFTGVDVKTEKSIIDLLLQLRDTGHTILVSTHDLASIATFCDRVILLNQTILATGSTEEVFTEENLAMTFGGLPTVISYQ
ncbi:MAG: metal ABC transporter ATP-binding protein [Xenococcus sp. MO_188.B8]|nr:metal ABC transporter ATP-binding protein [Xenococcus sp. MO_188.B8]